MEKVKLKEALNRELKSRNESITAMAKNCGLPVSVLHGWVKGTLPSAKNLHMVRELADYLGIPLSVLLFNVSDEEGTSTILFTSEFLDGDKRYKLTIEKIKE